MCITSTARRRSLTLQVLPSHLLTTSSTVTSKTTTADLVAAVAASSASPETQSTRPSNGKDKKSKSSSPMAAHAGATAPHHLPHHDGLVVQHHYHDHAADPTVDPSLVKHKAKGGVITPFPVKLHDMLDKIEADGLGHVVSWQPHGRCFVVHKPKEFVNHVMPHYFKQTKMASFQRQLNLYGFNRLTGGLDKGGYYHEMFLRGKVSLAYDIHRMRVKGTGVRLPTNPDNEPNFYALPPVTRDSVAAAMQTTMPAVMASSRPRTTSPSAMPPLPALPKPDASMLNMAQRRADLLRESHDHSRKIAQAKQRQQASQFQAQAQQPAEDLVFFEGLPFHYLDPSALPAAAQAQQQAQALARQQADMLINQIPPLAPVPVAATGSKSKFGHSSSVVSESDSSDNEQDPSRAYLPSFSPSNMDWDGPLSCPTLQAHMRRSSFQSFAKDASNTAVGAFQPPLEEDIETFFQSFDMPVDLYHEQIERMSDDDDTAFGYLLEQAITE